MSSNRLLKRMHHHTGCISLRLFSSVLSADEMSRLELLWPASLQTGCYLYLSPWFHCPQPATHPALGKAIATNRGSLTGSFVTTVDRIHHCWTNFLRTRIRSANKEEDHQRKLVTSLSVNVLSAKVASLKNLSPPPTWLSFSLSPPSCHSCHLHWSLPPPHTVQLLALPSLTTGTFSSFAVKVTLLLATYS